MKKLLCICSLFLMCLRVFAEPGWTEVQAVIRAQFHNSMNGAGAITKIIQRDEGSTLLNRDLFPQRYEFSQGVWVYYEGDLPGEIRRQVMSAYFNREIHQDDWLFDGLGIPVSGVTNEIINPPLETPDIPAPPDEKELKMMLSDSLQDRYSPERGLKEFNFENLTFNEDLEYQKIPGDYRDVDYRGNITAVFNMVVEDPRYAQTSKYTFTCTGTLYLHTSKMPASLWLESLDVDEWYMDFDHEYSHTVEMMEQQQIAPDMDKILQVVRNEFMKKAEKLETSAKQLDFVDIEVISNNDPYPAYGGGFTKLCSFKINYEEHVTYGQNVKTTARSFDLSLTLNMENGEWDYEDYDASFR